MANLYFPIFIAFFVSFVSCKLKFGCNENDISTLDIPLNSLSGIWFKVALKKHEKLDKTGFVIKLEQDGDQLKLTEYFERDTEECGGPMTGKWEKNEDGSLKISMTYEDTTWDANVKVVYHYTHSSLPEEELLGIYWCKEVQADGTCPREKQVAAILARSRHPSNTAILKLVRKMEKACVNPADFIDLNTDTPCGSEILPEDKQLSSFEASSESSSSSESSEGEDSSESSSSEEESCKVVDFAPQFMPNNPTELQALLGEWYQIAVIDDYFNKNDVIFFKVTNNAEQIEEEAGKFKAKYTMQRKGVCYEGETKEWVDPEDASIWNVETSFLHNGQVKTESVRFRSLFRLGNSYVTYFCDEEEENGKCAKERIGVWSKSKHISQKLMQNIYKKLRSICVDPAKLHYLNTHATCHEAVNPLTHGHTDTSMEDSEERCIVDNIPGVTHFNLQELKGVWYTVGTVAYTETDNDGNRVESITNERISSDEDNKLNSRFFIKYKDGECVGPLSATIKLLEAQKSTIEISASLPTGESKSTQKVLYAAPQYVVYYECLELADDGKCLRNKLRIDSRSRSVTHNDVMHMYRIMDKACVPRNSLEWLNPHSHCGMELDPPYKQRHNFLAMSHGDVMDIVLKHSQKNCKVADIIGVDVDVKKFADSSPWYGLAYFDNEFESYDIRGFYSKFDAVAPNTLVGREWVAMGGTLGVACTEIDSLMTVETDGNDVYLKATWDMMGATMSYTFRIIWHNNKLSIGYKCAVIQEDGTCQPDKASVFIMGHYETIDHTELMLMERIMDSICVDSKQIKFMNPHESCLHRLAMKPKAMYPVMEGCDPEGMVGMRNPPAEGVYHMQKILEKSDQLDRTTSVYKMETIDDDTIKVQLYATSGEACQEMNVDLKRVEGSESNEWSTKLEWNETPVTLSIWFGPSLGLTSPMIGCLTPDGAPKCSRKDGFYELHTTSRAVDPVKMSSANKWFADNCIDPKRMIMTDTRSSCGAEVDERSCVSTDASKFIEVEAATGAEYYLVMSANHRYESMKCVISEVNEEEAFVKTQCSASMAGKCIGPSDGVWRTEDKATWVTYEYEEHTIKMDMLYQDDEFILLYGCSTQNEDESCMAKRTNVMLFSKTKTVDYESLPEELKEKLKNMCVAKESLQFMKETTCGEE